MKVSENKVEAVIKLFKTELKNLFSEDEIRVIVFLSFHEYFGYSQSDLITKSDARLSESELLKFFRVITKLKENIPLQYIFGHTEFYRLNFKVNEHVLIPRPETEELVEWVLEGTKDGGRGAGQLTILDVGTGSGCIAIALKKNIPDAEVFALDISEKALEVAKENALKNSAQIQFIHANILSRDIITKSLNQQINFIVSNPPYITEAEKDAMHKNVLEHEPHLALFVPDNDALLFYRRILDFALDKLLPGGKIYFEMNNNYADAIAALAKEKGFKNGMIKKDINGNRRMFRCEKE